jgi:hypothetical protein
MEVFNFRGMNCIIFVIIGVNPPPKCQRMGLIKVEGEIE